MEELLVHTLKKSYKVWKSVSKRSINVAHRKHWSKSFKIEADVNFFTFEGNFDSDSPVRVNLFTKINYQLWVNDLEAVSWKVTAEPDTKSEITWGMNPIEWGHEYVLVVSFDNNDCLVHNCHRA